jgi:hypothetical protein
MEVQMVRGIKLTSVYRILEAYQGGYVGHHIAMKALHLRTFD